MERKDFVSHLPERKKERKKEKVHTDAIQFSVERERTVYSEEGIGERN